MILRWHRARVVILVGMTACAAPAAPDAPAEVEDDDPVASARGAVVTRNALTATALTANALTANALTANALTANALTANALTANALTSEALASDPLARELLRYVVGCALPAGKHLDLVLDGHTYGFDGALGLAAGWGKAGGHCDQSCRNWVSACVLARLNYLGETVRISIRGSRGELATSPAERQAYPVREATYYGDIFASPQLRLGCLSPGSTEDLRVCGPSLPGCAVQFDGDCEAACDAPKADGSYPNCRNRARGSNGHFPSGTAAFAGSITVFLAP